MRMSLPASVGLLLLASVCIGILIVRQLIAQPPSNTVNVSTEGKGAPPPSTKPADIAAFRDGGGLTGEAEKLAPPPMKLRWTYQTGETDHPAVEAAATISGDTVYVADDRGTLHAIELGSGKNKWKYTSEAGFDTTPLVMSGRVYLGDLSGLFHCISAETGKKIWTFDAENGIHSSANAVGSKILFGTDGAEIICLNSDGTKAWKAEAGDRINAAPAIGKGPAGETIALFSGCDAQLRAINVETGAEVFATDLGALAPGSPAMLKDRIFVGTDRGHVLCFTADGKPSWSFDKIEGEAMVYASPAVSDGVVVAAARDRKVYGLDVTTGIELWHFATRGEVDSSPLISDGRVYFGSKDKKLYVLDLKTGKSLWEFNAARAISAPPAIAHGVLVIGDTRGAVYCFEAQ